MTVALARRCSTGLPTWAKDGLGIQTVSVLCRTFSVRPARLEFPFRQALATTSKKDRDGISRAYNLRAHSEELLDELHRFDVGHGAQHGAPKALARGARLSASRQVIQGR